ncbi:MAG: TonB-dependent siderophore receptor [Burkholderiaceae bacterium]
MARLSRSRSRSRFARSPLAAAAALALAASCGTAVAQDAVQTVQVTARGVDASDVTGFAQPLSRTPLQATTIDASALADIGAISLSDLTRLDASLTDSYNAVGYWTTFSIRGFQVDNQHNFLRDGLPINAETVLALDNKSGVDILKGLSGMQAGTSAPGGLVNLVVKRPDADLRDASLGWSQDGTFGAAVDLSQRFGADRAFGARLNVSAARLDPNVHDARGHRQVLALATDWRIDPGRLLEFEFEHNLQSQPSVPGVSMLGDAVPDPHSIDPRLNLNDQPWSLPVVTQGNTMSLRYTQALPGDWRLKLHALQQQLVSNDHLAFDYGLYDADGSSCDPCDRFSSDGHYTIWDFRSDGERRTQRVGDASVAGTLSTGPLQHALAVGAQASRFTARFHDEAYNLAGTGTIDGRTMVPANPAADVPQDDRTERSTELYLRDTIALGHGWTAWVGLRHTWLHRGSMPTSGDMSSATDYRQAFTTPWVSVSRQLTPDDMVYASWGEGVESSVTPNLPTYEHPGQAEPATRSRQWEAGWKHAHGPDGWSVDAFDVRRPQYTDVPDDGDAEQRLVHSRDGDVASRGVEAEAQTRLAALTLRASAMWQRVRLAGSSELDGTRPPNVPDKALKLGATWHVAALPGLALLGDVGYEGGREVLPDDSARIPGWTRVDLAMRWTQPVAGARLTWRAGVNNAFDRRAWREAPYQYDHAYLFPLEPRTFFASVDASF